MYWWQYGGGADGEKISRGNTIDDAGIERIAHVSSMCDLDKKFGNTCVKGNEILNLWLTGSSSICSIGPVALYTLT